MNILSNRKKFVESRYAPEDTNVLWVSKSENEIEDIREFINGQWISILSESSENSTINSLVGIWGCKGSNFQVVSVDPNTDTIIKVQHIDESNNIYYIFKSEDIKSYLCPHNVTYNVGDKWSSEGLDKQIGAARLVAITKITNGIHGLIKSETVTPPQLQAVPTEEEIEAMKLFYTDITKGISVKPILVD